MNLTTETFSRYLGRPAEDLLSDAHFKDWKFERSIVKDVKRPRIDYLFPSNGFDFICDLDGKVRTIFLHAHGNRQFADQLVDLPFSATRTEVLSQFGAPSKSGGVIKDPILGEFGPWDRFTVTGHSIHVEYSPNCENIRKITFMRADVVP